MAVSGKAIFKLKLHCESLVLVQTQELNCKQETVCDICADAGDESGRSPSRPHHLNRQHSAHSDSGVGDLSEQEVAWRSRSADYEQRFCGHCNTTTDIKEANFFGRCGPRGASLRVAAPVKNADLIELSSLSLF